MNILAEMLVWAVVYLLIWVGIIALIIYMTIKYQEKVFLGLGLVGFLAIYAFMQFIFAH